jgi:hypothetical protein
LRVHGLRETVGGRGVSVSTTGLTIPSYVAVSVTAVDADTTWVTTVSEVLVVPA